MLEWLMGGSRLNLETTSMEAQTAARQEWLSEHDPNCDMCAEKDRVQPIRPVYRCPMHMSCMAGMVGDPLFGFEFKRYRDAPHEAGN
jgi:hypothetical protein